ncbi:MAG TPA: glycosyltransferase, partial [Chloroflexota bacterium]|nr:glycosyltransferase [Chloroflexota bacterium]
MTAPAVAPSGDAGASAANQTAAPKTVIVLPTYNEAENLRLMVAALLALKPPVEILVVDDASPDGTGSIADELA